MSKKKMKVIRQRPTAEEIKKRDALKTIRFVALFLILMSATIGLMIYGINSSYAIM